MIFVIDNSGSMGGTSIRQAKASLLVGLDRLRPGDRFNVVRFDDTMETVFPDVVAADADHLAQAKRFVAGLEARGGTEMLAPLRAALEDAHPEETGRVRQVVFLTDGAIGDEARIFKAVAEERGRTRLFMVGIGSAPNGHLMRHAAELGRGTFTQIASVAEVADRMRDLLVKLESPVVTDLAATFSEEAEVTPAQLPDLYRGEPVTIAARMRPAEGRPLWGRSPSPAGSAIRPGAPCWTSTGAGGGRHRQGLGPGPDRRGGDRADHRADDPEASDAAILRLALDHGLTTRLTSLVAIDATPRRPRGARLARADLPLNLPAGWDFEALFGQDVPHDPGPTLHRRAELIPAAARGIALPQTATDHEVRLMLGAVLLALALLLRIGGRRVAR